MSEKINLTKARANPLDFLECASEDDLLALVEAVAAAREVADLPSAVVNSGAHERLREALSRFEFGQDR